MCEGPGDLGSTLMRGCANLRRENPWSGEGDQHDLGFEKGWQSALDRVEVMLQAWIPGASESSGWAEARKDTEANGRE